MLQTIKSSRNPHTIPDTVTVVPEFKVVHRTTDILPKVLTPLMQKQPFKDAYDISLGWKPDHVNPLDREVLNPLALHNAKLDGQYALRKFTNVLEADTETNQKKSFTLKKLLENPTVDFKRVWQRFPLAYIQKVIDLGDVDNFITLYAKLSRRVTPQNLVEYAAEKGKLGIFKYLVEDKRLLEKYSTDDLFLIQKLAASSGELELVQYLFDDFKFLNGKHIEMNPKIQYKAAESGNTKVLEYIFTKYEKTHGTDFPINPRIQHNAAASGNIELIEYLFKKYKSIYKAQLPIDPTIQYKAIESGNLDFVEYIVSKYEASKVEDFPIDPKVQLQAIESGNLDILKYVFKKYKSIYQTQIPIDPEIQYYASKSGNLDFLRYLIDEKGLPIDYGMIVDGSHWAISSDPNYVTQVMKYLNEEKGSGDYLENQIND